MKQSSLVTKSAKTLAIHQKHTSSHATTTKEQKWIPLTEHAFSFAETTKRESFFPKKLSYTQVSSVSAKYAHMATEKTFVAFDFKSPYT